MRNITADVKDVRIVSDMITDGEMPASLEKCEIRAIFTVAYPIVSALIVAKTLIMNSYRGSFGVYSSGLYFL